jgi:hypothetical protein
VRWFLSSPTREKTMRRNINGKLRTVVCIHTQIQGIKTVLCRQLADSFFHLLLHSFYRCTRYPSLPSFFFFFCVFACVHAYITVNKLFVLFINSTKNTNNTTHQLSPTYQRKKKHKNIQNHKKQKNKKHTKTQRFNVSMFAHMKLC